MGLPGLACVFEISTLELLFLSAHIPRIFRIRHARYLSCTLSPFAHTLRGRTPDRRAHWGLRVPVSRPAGFVRKGAERVPTGWAPNPFSMSAVSRERPLNTPEAAGLRLSSRPQPGQWSPAEAQVCRSAGGSLALGPLTKRPQGRPKIGPRFGGADVPVAGTEKRAGVVSATARQAGPAARRTASCRPPQTRRSPPHLR